MRTKPNSDPGQRGAPPRSPLYRRLPRALHAKLRETRARLRRRFSQEALPDSLRAKWSAPSSAPGFDADTLRYYREQGYTKGIRLLDDEDIAFVQSNFRRLVNDVGINHPGPTDRMPNLQMWHRHNDWIFQLCTHTRLLDAVEQILGPDVVLWGTEFYVKFPGDRDIVPWHQDGAFWESAVSPIEAVTVFLPLFDVDRENGCMQVLPRTHTSENWALLRYPEHPDVVFGQEIRDDEFDASLAVHAELQAGEMMFHHPALLHMSGPNLSKRLKAVLTMRFGTPKMKCDLGWWPDFKIALVRGQDRYGHNPVAPIPARGANRVPPRPQRYRRLDPPTDERQRKRSPPFVTAESPVPQG